MVRKIIDLSQDIYNDHPVFPAHCKTHIFMWETMEFTRSLGFTNPFHADAILMSSHGPTHVDALNEYADPNDKSIMDVYHIPLEWTLNDGICIDVSFVKPNTWITPEDLEKALAKSGLEIPKGGTLLLYTGHYDKNHPLNSSGEKWLTEYPGLGVEASHWIADQGIKNVGVDTPSIDKGDDMACVAHLVFMERQMLNTENLCNLDKVLNKKFLYIGLPLKIKEYCTGSPIRAVAVLDE
ncbi:MAG: cyclase family protein [Candidatus Thorarchaeota archaeon]